MTNRSILVAAAFAILVTGASTSSFARGGGAAGGGGSSSGGGTGGSGAHAEFAILNPGPVPGRTQMKAVAIDRQDIPCTLGPAANGFFGPDRATFTQICVGQF
jgi:hypothetical protein